MPEPKKLRWSKAALGEWHGREVDFAVSPVVAVAAKTGTHLDHYPWDWYFTDYGMKLVPTTLRPCLDGDNCPNPKIHRRQHAGVTDTLRAAKEVIEETLS